MSWREVLAHSNKRRDRISVSVTLEDTRFTLQFFIGLDALEHAGLEPTSRVHIFAGEGDSAGEGAIVADTDGSGRKLQFRAVMKGGSRVRVPAAAWPAYFTKKIDPTPLAWRIEDMGEGKAIVFTLPDWLKEAAGEPVAVATSAPDQKLHTGGLVSVDVGRHALFESGCLADRARGPIIQNVATIDAQAMTAAGDIERAAAAPAYIADTIERMEKADSVTSGARREPLKIHAVDEIEPEPPADTDAVLVHKALSEMIPVAAPWQVSNKGVAGASGVPQPKITDCLNQLVEDGHIERTGGGRSRRIRLLSRWRDGRLVRIAADPGARTTSVTVGEDLNGTILALDDIEAEVLRAMLDKGQDWQRFDIHQFAHGRREDASMYASARSGLIRKGYVEQRGRVPNMEFRPVRGTGGRRI